MNLEELHSKYDKYFNMMNTEQINEVQSLLTSAKKDLISAEDEIIQNQMALKDIEDQKDKLIKLVQGDPSYIGLKNGTYWIDGDKSSKDNSNGDMILDKWESYKSQYTTTYVSIDNLNSKIIPYLKERIAYFTYLLLEESNKNNPYFIPNKYKLESEDFNKIAHFRILPAFNATINSYVQDSVILTYKRKLMESIIDNRSSFRFTMLPLFIQNISYGSNERSNMLPLIGDIYDAYHYGRSPQILSISGILLDTPETNASAAITMLYMDFFRLSHVSRIGVPLTLEIGDKLFTGAFVSLNMNKTTQGFSDLLQIDFEFLVLEYFAYSQYNRLEITNTHSVLW